MSKGLLEWVHQHRKIKEDKEELMKVSQGYDFREET
jgi:hypothetical protein